LADLLCENPQPYRSRADLLCFALVLVSFATGLAASWQRWGNPLVDSGRELNVPLRLLRGEMLYSDVSYLYGPLSAYLNALLYRVFHPSLWTIWGHGIAATVLILVLTYWLTRQISGPFAATVSCVGVTWLCALKPQGNYMLAYSFGGLDGCLFVLMTTAASVLWWKKSSWRWALVAGVNASLAILSKTELGIAALCIGVVTAALAGFPRPGPTLLGLARFLVPAIGIPAAVFARLAARAGWTTLAVENHLFFGHIPWQLVYFNQVRFGFDRPWHSAELMILSLIRLLSVGGLLASIAIFVGRRRAKGQNPSTEQGRVLALLGSSLAGLVLTTFGVADLGPLIPMPILLITLGAGGVAALARAGRQGSAADRRQAGISIILIASALACLLRIFLRVSTGGALSSFLLTLSIVLFVYLWLHIFPKLLPDVTARHVARRLVSILFVVGLLAAAGTLSVRYRHKFNCPLVTSRGTWRVTPEHGIAFGEALRFIEQRTTTDDTVAVLPEGTSLNFFSGRRNPLREEIATPGFLDAAGEERAIGRLRKAHTPVILLANRLTPEFAQSAFGRDYDQRIFSWIEQNYRRCGLFGMHPDAGLPLGSPVFFIRAYCVQPAS
jgi:4-amino-4-deoxy-L-arabinose transferase-like glycosyltransferase